MAEDVKAIGLGACQGGCGSTSRCSPVVVHGSRGTALRLDIAACLFHSQRQAWVVTAPSSPPVMGHGVQAAL
jgi:hypothetical protein